jgi:hypothetical protein
MTLTHRLIFELIQGEIEYVADLESIETLFLKPLQKAGNPIIDDTRVKDEICEIFSSYRSILEVHSGLLDDLVKRQLQQHPYIFCISDIFLKSAPQWNKVYLGCMSQYPLAKAKVEAEAARNPRFKALLEVGTVLCGIALMKQDASRNPVANRHGFDHFMYRPIARLLRYPLLLKELPKVLETMKRQANPDFNAIPRILEKINALSRALQDDVANSACRSEARKLQSELANNFWPNVAEDLDLLNPARIRRHKGRVSRHPVTGSGGSALSDLLLLLLDNFLLLVEETDYENDDIHPRYRMNFRPIPLELLSLGDFQEPPLILSQNRALVFLKTLRQSAILFANRGDD